VPPGDFRYGRYLEIGHDPLFPYASRHSRQSTHCIRCLATGVFVTRLFHNPRISHPSVKFNAQARYISSMGLDVGDWSASPPRPFTPRGHKPRRPSDSKFGGLRSRSRRCGYDNLFLPLPGTELQFIGHSSRSIIAIPTELSWFLCVRFKPKFLS
jgi:hypothetical protein